VTHPDYHRALEAATREYEDLARQRADLDHRLAQLAQTMGTLMRLCGLTPTVPWGLTDLCRMVLKTAGHPLSAVEVRAQLGAMGVDLSRYSNVLASIHTVLKRLSDSGEVRFVPRVHERPAYEWTAPVRAASVGRTAGPAGRRRKRRNR
jgi:hypothetical protein